MTIDSGPPTSSVAALPVAETSASFPVSLVRRGRRGRLGIASYSIYVSEDGGVFQPWLTDTTETSATYTGQFGHTYSFYSVATDNAGNVQPTPASPQATRTLFAAPAVTGVSPAAGPFAGGTKVTITGTGFAGATAVGFGSAAATTFTVNSKWHANHSDQPGGDGRGGRDGDYAPRQVAREPAGRRVRLRAGGDGDQSRGGTADRRRYGDDHGTGFSGATAVDFGTIKAAKFVVKSATQITATSPAGTGVVNVTVVGATALRRGPGRCVQLRAGGDGDQPRGGPATGGTSVTITGANLLKAMAVKFGSVAGKIVSDTATKIVVKSPPARRARST